MPPPEGGPCDGKAAAVCCCCGTGSGMTSPSRYGTESADSHHFYPPHSHSTPLTTSIFTNRSHPNPQNIAILQHLTPTDLTFKHFQHPSRLLYKHLYEFTQCVNSSHSRQKPEESGRTWKIKRIPQFPRVKKIGGKHVNKVSGTNGAWPRSVVNPCYHPVNRQAALVTLCLHCSRQIGSIPAACAKRLVPST